MIEHNTVGVQRFSFYQTYNLIKKKKYIIYKNATTFMRFILSLSQIWKKKKKLPNGIYVLDKTWTFLILKNIPGKLYITRSDPGLRCYIL